MFLRQYATCPILLKIRLKEPLILDLSGMVVQYQKVADSSEKGIKQRVRKLKPKILSSLTQPFFSLSVQPTPDHTKLFTPICLLMRLEGSKGLSALQLLCIPR